MKHMLIACAIATATTCTVYSAEPAKEDAATSPLAVEITLDAASAYLWRGAFLNDETVLQPSVDVSCGNLGATVWGNVNLTRQNPGEQRLDEVDLYFYYTLELGPLSVEAGQISYLPTDSVTGGETNHATHEVYVSVAFENDLVTPSMSVYYDYDEVKGFYTSLALAREIELADSLTLTPGISAGYGSADFNSYYFDVDKSRMVDGTASVAIEWKPGDTYSYNASVTYTRILDGNIRDSVEENDLYPETEGVVVKVGAKVSF